MRDVLGRVVSGLGDKQRDLAHDILTKLKIGSEEMNKALYRYRAMADVMADIEGEQAADRDAANKL